MDESVSIVRNAAQKLSWCLCIFFSIDLEGATAYKVQKRKQVDDNDWCSVFESFYKELPIRFIHAYRKPANSQTTTNTTEPVLPTLWKFVGDEVLLYSPLTSSRQIPEHLRAFRQTIIDYNKKLKQQNMSVRCKGTAWIAGFPINNRIVFTPNKTAQSRNFDSELAVDFIGSSIDCGFRLTKFSSPRMLVISLDLAWMLAETVKNFDATDFDSVGSKIRYAGKHELKGVFSGKPCPVFWLDTLDEAPVEDKWLSTAKQCKCVDVVKFCEQFASDINTDDFARPFIEKDASGFFECMPKDFANKRHVLEAYKKKTSNVQNSEGDSQTSSGNPKQIGGIVEIRTDKG
ncbi:MAG: hypothetical protein LBU65_17720 [Planctomycetaceae bacterium]|jgi:hypothetical protein|nr:hypothetical protein [Planctomycetaceae bacterium]